MKISLIRTLYFLFFSFWRGRREDKRDWLWWAGQDSSYLVNLSVKISSALRSIDTDNYGQHKPSWRNDIKISRYHIISPLSSHKVSLSTLQLRLANLFYLWRCSSLVYCYMRRLKGNKKINGKLMTVRYSGKFCIKFCIQIILKFRQISLNSFYYITLNLIFCRVQPVDSIYSHYFILLKYFEYLTGKARHKEIENQ